VPGASLGRFERFLEHGDELAVKRRSHYGTDEMRETASRPLPSEVYEWEWLLEAVAEAGRRFTMVELGAGYGRWTIRGAAALRRYRRGVRYRLIAVEAEPTHFHWLKQHARDNRLRRWSPAGSVRLVNAAVSRHGGREEDFFVGDADHWYGQALVRSYNESSTAQYATAAVKTVTLTGLLGQLDHVDLIDIDIQGAELEVLDEAKAVLDRVRRIYVETHSDEIHEQLHDVLVAAAGDWTPVVDIPLGARRETPLGEATFEDGGVQLWLNRQLTPAQSKSGPASEFRCPQCGAPIDVPRAAYFGRPGDYTAECPNGHPVTLRSEFTPADN
jgi:FkbM family methyltransferase